MFFVEFFNSFKMVFGDPTFLKHLTNYTLRLEKISLVYGFMLICIKINRYNEKKSVGKMVFFWIVFSVLPGKYNFYEKYTMYP